MSTQVERKTLINKSPVYMGLTILLGLVIAAGLLLGATLANSAKDVFAGTGLGNFMGEQANEVSSLGAFVIAALVFGIVLYCRFLYVAAREKALLPII